MKPYILEFDSVEITNTTYQIWKSIGADVNLYGKKLSSSYNEDFKQRNIFFQLDEKYLGKIKNLFPFINGNIIFLEYGPGGSNPPHIDGLSTSKNLFEYNLIIPVENSKDTVTSYLSDVPVRDYVEYQTRHPIGLEENFNKEFNIEFQHVITRPCLFYSQKLHTAKNIGNRTRVAAIWKLENRQTVNDILLWAKKSYIHIEEIF